MGQTLDDVDFTILAATSVLRDLIDKCPPAEACRDAFERMSRATVKLCLSTTGFGLQGTSFHARQRQESSPGRDEAWPWLKQQQPEHSAARVEVDEARGIVGNGGSRRWQASTRPITAVQPQLFRSFSPASASEQQCESYTSTQPMPISGATGVASSDDALYGMYNESTSELDALLADKDTTIYDSQFGINLGYGDGHDWSEGVQLDLFDGFFFGGTNNGEIMYGDR
ncbi:MAG: hypothetical protein Q9170_000335 [Blastenia crenularia]